MDVEFQTPVSVSWLKLQSFARRNRKPTVLLTMYAALPLELTPELLHLIRVNFVTPHFANAHFMDEADLLLSDLVRDIGGGSYAFEPDLREMLLRQLQRLRE